MLLPPESSLQLHHCILKCSYFIIYHGGFLLSVTLRSLFCLSFQVALMKHYFLLCFTVWHCEFIFRKIWSMEIFCYRCKGILFQSGFKIPSDDSNFIEFFGQKGPKSCGDYNSNLWVPGSLRFLSFHIFFTHRQEISLCDPLLLAHRIFFNLFFHKMYKLSKPRLYKRVFFQALCLSMQDQPVCPLLYKQQSCLPQPPGKAVQQLSSILL